MFIMSSDIQPDNSTTLIDIDLGITGAEICFDSFGQTNSSTHLSHQQPACNADIYGDHFRSRSDSTRRTRGNRRSCENSPDPVFPQQRPQRIDCRDFQIRYNGWLVTPNRQNEMGQEHRAAKTDANVGSGFEHGFVAGLFHMSIPACSAFLGCSTNRSGWS